MTPLVDNNPALIATSAESKSRKPARPQSAYFNLPNNVISRASRLGTDKFSGSDVVNVICVIACHINALTRKTWVAPRTIASETNLRVKVVDEIIVHAEAAGILQLGTWNGRRTYGFVANDDGGGHRFISLQWWTENAALGKSRGLLQQLMAIADGHCRFTMNVRKDLLPRLGLSRAGFYRLLAPLVTCGKVQARQRGRATEFEMLDMPRKRPRSVSAESPSVSANRPSVSADPANSLSGTVLRTEGYIVQGYEDQEVLKTRLEQDQRHAEKRADAVATIPIILPSEDQKQNQSAAVSQEAQPTHDGCTCVEGWLYVQNDKGHTVTKRCQRWLAWVKAGRLVSAAWLHGHHCDGGWIRFANGESLLCPQCAASVSIEKHGCKDGWRPTSDDGIWHCPHCRAREHGCLGGYYSKTEQRLIASSKEYGDEIVLKPCPQCAKRREAAQPRKDAWDFNIFARPTLALPPAPASPPAQTRTIEGQGQWRESKPPAPARQRIAGDVLPPKMYHDCWKGIAVHTNLYREGWDEETRKRVDGMLQKGGVAHFGAEEFRKAIVDVLAEQWERKHAHCHDHCTCSCDPCQCQDGLCDGTCGHAEDECNGMPQCIHEPKRLLDLVGHALQWLRQDEKFGRDFNSGCPNPIYQRMFAA